MQVQTDKLKYPIRRYIKPIDQVKDVRVTNATVEFVRRDEEFQHIWVRVTPKDRDVYDEVFDKLMAESNALLPDDEREFTKHIGRSDDGSFYVRIARCGQNMFGVFRKQSGEVVWQPQALAEEDDIKKLKETFRQSRVFDVDLCAAGAFTFEDGHYVTLVCRRLYQLEEVAEPCVVEQPLDVEPPPASGML